MHAATHLVHRGHNRAHHASKDDKDDKQSDDRLSPGTHGADKNSATSAGLLAAKERKRRSSSFSHQSSDSHEEEKKKEKKEKKTHGKGKAPMVALDADSSIDTFLEVYLDGKFSNEKIKRWQALFNDHEIQTVGRLKNLDSLPSKWDRLALPLGVEWELRDALKVVLSPSKEEDDKGNEEDDKEKESTEPIDLVSGEPEWVRQVRDKLLQIYRTAPRDPKTGNIGEVTYVLLQIGIVKIQHVDTLTMDADAEIEFSMWWMDQRLKNAGDGGPDDWKPLEGDSWSMKTMWKPDPQIEGLADAHPVDHHEENFWIWPSWVPHGIVSHTQKWAGRLSIPMHLTDFPFDQQTIIVKVISPSYDTETGIIFVPYGHSEKGFSEEMQKAIHLIEFAKNGPLRVHDERVWIELEGVEKSVVTVSQSIRRHTGFYLAKVVSLIFLIGCAVWVVPVLPPSALNDRFTIVVTILLTQIALNFVLAESLPKVPYLTRMDTYLLLNYIFLCLSAMECVAAYLIDKNKPNAKAVKYLDYATIGVLIVVHVSNTVRFIIQGYLFSHRAPPAALPSLTGAHLSSSSVNNTNSTTPLTAQPPSTTTAHVELKVVPPGEEDE